MNREIRDLIYSVLPNKYLQYKNNRSPLILSAPHGGGMKPISIPKRKYGVLVADTYTRRITNNLVNEEFKGSPPSYLISDIHRSRVDFNRDFEEATQGNDKAFSLWQDWNIYMNLLCKSATANGTRKALYIDIHSHNDSNKFELGYNLSAREYLRVMNTGKTKATSTLDTLGKDNWEMMFGDYSFKNSLEIFGYDTLVPTGKEVYFNGGRNIEKLSGNGVAAIQIEIPVSIAEAEMGKLIFVLKFAIQRFRKEFVYDNRVITG